MGDPSKPGPYTIRLKILPLGYKLAPHTHPDPREVTILSGTWYTGYGEQADPALLQALPAGSFYTEPANLPHFVEVREAVVIQVSGVGPSGRAFVELKNEIAVMAARRVFPSAHRLAHGLAGADAVTTLIEPSLFTRLTRRLAQVATGVRSSRGPSQFSY